MPTRSEFSADYVLSRLRYAALTTGEILERQPDGRVVCIRDGQALFEVASVAEAAERLAAEHWFGCEGAMP